MFKNIPNNKASGRPISAPGQNNRPTGGVSDPKFVNGNPAVGKQHLVRVAYDHNNPNAKPIKAPGQSKANGVQSLDLKHPARIAYEHNAPKLRGTGPSDQTPFGV